ncbi:MAG TPA: BatA and WFA domain-containing protein [Gemmatimonadales bacterium]|nr:BatA and WFA domain-containing protein [Gemmatimonadales bacterium]
MSLLVPAFLAGLAALLVPLLIHLRQREWERPRRFPSLMFLRRIPIRTARRRRITDWLLLLLRAGVFALLVAAFARPFFHRAATTATAAPARAVVLLLDRSMSMGHREVWPAALDSARRLVAGLGPRDRAGVILFDEESELAQPLTGDRAAVLAALNAARPTSRGTRYAAALRSARQLLAGAPGAPGQILVITDLQRSGLAGLAGLELPADVEVRAVPVQPASRANATVLGAEVQRVPVGTQSELLVSARLMARELGVPRRTRLSLTVNGRAAGSREVTLPADGPVTAAFDPVPLAAGRASAELSLAPDALTADDAFRFVVPPEQAVRVLLVTAPGARPDETLFLERALAIGREPRFVVERRAGIDARALRGAGVVLLVDAPLPGGPAGAALDAWVRGGGGLLVAAGERLAARPLAQPLLPGAVRGSLDRLSDRGGSFGEVSLDHPVFAPFREGGGAALGAARFLRYPRLEPVGSAVVLARFDDGLPALLEQPQGAGRVLLLAVPLDDLAGDFPLQPAYLPFLRRLAVYAAGHQAVPLWRTTGETGIVPAEVRDPVVATPGGALLRPASDSGPCTLVLTEAGFYQTYSGRAAGEPLDVVAANPPAGESDLTPADPRELLLGVRRGDSSAVGPAAPPAPAEREARQRVWRILLIAAAVLLLAETIVANRGWRGTATHVLPAPPERNTP